MLAVLVTLALELHARPRAGRRAEALVLLSDIEGESGRLERSIELRREALEAAAGQPTLLVEIHQWLGNVCSVHGGRGCGRSTRRSGARAGRRARRRLSACGCALRARLRSLPGRPSGRAVSGRADRSAREVCRRPATAARDQLHGREPSSSGRTSSSRARTLLQSIDREWSERDELAKAYVLWWLGMIELRCGRFPIAADYAERCSRDRAPIHDRRPRRAGRLAGRADRCASRRARSRALPHRVESAADRGARDRTLRGRRRARTRRPVERPSERGGRTLRGCRRRQAGHRGERACHVLVARRLRGSAAGNWEG